jgi:hypothetical protein
MCRIEQKKYDFYYLAEDAIEHYRTNEEKDFDALHLKLQKEHGEQNGPAG